MMKILTPCLTQSRSLSAARMSTGSPQTSRGTSCITSMTSTKCFHSAKWWRTCGTLVGFATCLRCLGRMRRSAGGRRFPIKCGNGLLCDLRTRSTEQWLRQNCVTRGTCGLNVALVLTSSSIQTRFSVTGLQLVPSARPNGVAMPRIHRLIVGLLVLVPLAVSVASTVAHAEKRIALVIGNAGYQAGSLNTPANDAGLIAQPCRHRASMS
jgi:hypothetical protein